MVNSNVRAFDCPVCNKCLKSSSSLTTHLLTHSGIKQHTCSWCNKGFTQKGTLVRHEQTHTGGRVFRCEACSKTFTRKDKLQEHFCTHVDLCLKCELCGKTFGSKRKLSHHLVLHSTERPYKCDLCDSAFVCSNYLSGHRRKVHNVKNAVYQCDCCSKFCKSRHALSEHKKSHSSERPYICHLCPHTSKYSHNFRLHLRQHECAKPYICQVCLKAFSSPATLYQHNRIHLGKREFQCEKCGKHFQRQHHLQTHSLSHSDEKRFSCKYCGKMFKYKAGLRVHCRTHTGARPYVCDLCGWRFSQRGRMRSHRLTHTGEKPFTCIACGKAFCRHDKLTDHCRRMHKQDVAAALGHAAKTKVEQDDGGDGAVGVSFSETKAQLTDDATESFTDTDDVGTDIGNQINALEGDFVAKSPDVTLTSSFKASSEYSSRQVGAVSSGSAAIEPLRTRSGRSYGKSVDHLEFGKHSVMDQSTSYATGDCAKTKISGKIDPENIDDKDFTEIVEIIDITPVASFAESNYTVDGLSYKKTDTKQRSVYSSDESESAEFCHSPTSDEDETDSQPYCESSDTEGVGERFGSDSVVNPSKSGYSPQNPNEIGCVLPETSLIQNDDEDFLFAMRIFERLKELSSDDHKNSVKLKIEQIFMCSSNTT